MLRKLQIVTYRSKNSIGSIFTSIGQRNLSPAKSIPVSSGRDWEARVISNPSLRGTGIDEKSAMEDLKFRILCEIGITNPDNYDSLSFQELSFDDVEIETIMNS